MLPIDAAVPRLDSDSISSTSKLDAQILLLQQLKQNVEAKLRLAKAHRAVAAAQEALNYANTELAAAMASDAKLELAAAHTSQHGSEAAAMAPEGMKNGEKATDAVLQMATPANPPEAKWVQDDPTSLYLMKDEEGTRTDAPDDMLQLISLKSSLKPYAPTGSEAATIIPDGLMNGEEAEDAVLHKGARVTPYGTQQHMTKSMLKRARKRREQKSNPKDGTIQESNNEAHIDLQMALGSEAEPKSPDGKTNGEKAEDAVLHMTKPANPPEAKWEPEDETSLYLMKDAPDDTLQPQKLKSSLQPCAPTGSEAAPITSDGMMSGEKAEDAVLQMAKPAHPPEAKWVHEDETSQYLTKDAPDDMLQPQNLKSSLQPCAPTGSEAAPFTSDGKMSGEKAEDAVLQMAMTANPPETKLTRPSWADVASSSDESEDDESDDIQREPYPGAFLAFLEQMLAKDPHNEDARSLHANLTRAMAVDSAFMEAQDAPT